MTTRGKVPQKNRYKPIRQLGAGSFATVVLARDLVLNRDVAVKVLRIHDNDEILTRFEREARICMDLRHPNVIRIYDASIEGNKPNIVMEYLDAGDLAELIERRPLSVLEVISISDQLADGLDYLHSLNILHRDLKPENVMVKDPLIPVLMDFNLAFSNRFTELTKEGCSIGTPRFMPPEIMLGEKATEASDVFSLGLIVYDMLTGGFVSTARLTIPELINGRVPSKPSVSNKEVTGELDDLVMWSVQNDPEKRCPSMKAFLKKLSLIKKSYEPEVIEEARGRGRALRKESVLEDTGACEVVSSASDIESLDTSVFTVRRMAAFIFFFLFLVFIVFGIVHGSKKSLRTPAGSSVSETNNAADEFLRASNLYKTALDCQNTLPLLDDFNVFFAEEASLFSETRGEKEKIDSHCALLRGILAQIEKGTIFSFLLEHRFRMRKNDSYSGIQILQKCDELYWDQMKLAEGRDSGTAGIGNLLFNKLWKDQSNNPVDLRKLVDRTTESFYELPRVIRRASDGRAFLHSLALCEMYLDASFLPEGSKVLLLPPPYENSLLKEIRKLVTEKIINRRHIILTSVQLDRIDQAAPFDDGEEFLRQSVLSLDSTQKYMKAGNAEISVLRQQAIERNDKGRSVTGYSRREHTQDIKLKYDVIIRSYLRYANLSRIMMGLSDNEAPWTGCVFETLRNCLNYGSYNYIYLYTLGADPLSATGPGSLTFARKYLRYVAEAAILRFQFENYASAEWLIFTFNKMLPDCARLKDPVVNKILTDFLETLRQKAPLTAVGTHIFLSQLFQTSAPDFMEISHAFDSLMEKEKSLKKSEFRGWSVITALVGNELFLQMKKEGLKADRAKLSLVLSEKIARYYKDGDYWIKVRMYHRYSGPSILRMTSIIHVCDAFLAQGKNFMEEEPELSEKLQIMKVLDKLSNDINRSDGSGAGTVAASKLVIGVGLESHDIVMNPLRYW